MTCTYESLVHQLGLDVRHEQSKLYNDIIATSAQGSALFAQADTGIGKTLAIAAACADIISTPTEVERKIVIATSSLQLCKAMQSELSSLDIDASILMSFRNYFSDERIELVAYQRPELATQLELMLAWTDTIEAFEAEYGGLPDGVSASMVCQTDATKSDTYIAERDKALKSTLIITSHAMIAVDMLQSGRVLSLSHYQTDLIVDEADAFIDFLITFNMRSFNIFREFSHIKTLCSSRFQDVLFDTGSKLKEDAPNTKPFSLTAKTTALDSLNILSGALRRHRRRNLSMEDVAYIADFEEYLDWALQHVTRSKDVSVSLTTVKQEPTINIFSPYFSRVFGRYSLTHMNSVTLMSGTLSVDNDVNKGTEWVKRALKLEGRSILRRAYSPKRFGSLTLSLYRSDRSLYKTDDKAALNLGYVNDVSTEIDKLAGKTLIITASFDEAERYAAKLNVNHANNVILHKRGSKLSPLKKSFINAKGTAFLISPSAHTGLNFTDDNSRSVLKNIVATRLGFGESNKVLASLKNTPDFPDAKLDSLVRSDYFNNLNRVIRRTKQIIGRGIRHIDDSVHVFIADKRFPAFEDVLNKHAPLRHAIPARFIGDYQNATMIKHVESVRAEDSALDLTLL